MNGHKPMRRTDCSTPDPSVDEVLRRGIIGLVDNFSIEVTPGDAARIVPLAVLLRPGNPVYICSPSGSLPGDVVEAALRLHATGLQPVPHVAARSFADIDRLGYFLHRLTGEAAVDQVLVVGGERGRHMGEFKSALQLMETGLLQQFGIRRIGLAGYPDGHPEIARHDLMAALRAKVAYAHDAGIEAYVVTQFCFDLQAILDWERELLRAVGDISIHVGVPGPISITKLIRYARICGIGPSVRFLTRGASSVRKLATWTPEGFLTALADYRASRRTSIAATHFYSFGSPIETASWLSSVVDGRFTMNSDGRGFEAAQRA